MGFWVIGALLMLFKEGVQRDHLVTRAHLALPALVVVAEILIQELTEVSGAVVRAVDATVHNPWGKILLRG